MVLADSWGVMPGTAEFSCWYLANWKQKRLVLRHKWFAKFSPGDLPTATHPLKLKSESLIFQGQSSQKCQATYPATHHGVCLIPKTVEDTVWLKVFFVFCFFCFFFFFGLFGVLFCFVFLVSFLQLGELKLLNRGNCALKFVSPACLRE